MAESGEIADFVDKFMWADKRGNGATPKMDKTDKSGNGANFEIPQVDKSGNGAKAYLICFQN